jgi:hypothetical protein
MIKLIILLFTLLSVNLSNAAEITTGNLLPNAGQGASSAQSIDSSVPKIGSSFNSFTSSNVTDFSNEVEVTGTGSLSYNGSLLNITTGDDTTNQTKLNNGITLQSNTIVQNCEWANSSFACGNRGVGRDSYSTHLQILDSNGSVLSEINQNRNNDAGYGANSFKYTDTLIFNNVGASQFNWQWTGIDGQSNPGTLGGPNLLGANLFMTYDNSQLNQAVTQELNEVNKTLTESVKKVIIEEKVKVKSNIQTAPVAKTNTPSSPVTKTPAATTTNAAPKPTQQVTQKTTTPTATKSNETKKTNETKSNSSTTKTTSTKKQNSTKQKNLQSKENKKSTIASALNKVDEEIKDVGKNLEVKNLIRIKAMTENQDLLTLYSMPFYPQREIYVDQISIADNRDIYKNISLNNYIEVDPIVNFKKVITDIKLQKQKLLDEIEVLVNG